MKQRGGEIRVPIPLLIGAFFFLFYLATLGGKDGYATDSNENFHLSLAILRDGDFFPAGDDTRIYHGYAFSTLPLPFIAAADVIAEAFYPARLRMHVLRNALCVYNMAATALTLVLFYLIARRLRFRQSTAVSLTLALGLSTLIFPYARYDFNQPNATLFLVLFAWFLLRWRDSRRFFDIAGAGLALGVAVWSRTEFGLLVFVLLAVLIRHRERNVRSWAVALGPFAAALCFVLLYNWHYWGADKILMGGYGQTPHGGSLLLSLWGNFLSPGKSVLIYCPVVALGLVGLVPFFRRTKETGAVWFACGAIVYLFYSFGSYWYGGWCWGPRLTLPLLPALVMAAGPLLEAPRAAMRRLYQCAFAALALAGFAIQWLGILVDFNVGLTWLLKQATEMQIYTTWRFHPFTGQYNLIAAGVSPDLAMVAHVTPGGTSGLFVAVFTAIVMAMLCCLVLLVQHAYLCDEPKGSGEATA